MAVRGLSLIICPTFIVPSIMSPRNTVEFREVILKVSLIINVVMSSLCSNCNHGLLISLDLSKVNEMLHTQEVPNRCQDIFV
jgi:hypothetical protein